MKISPTYYELNFPRKFKFEEIVPTLLFHDSFINRMKDKMIGRWVGLTIEENEVGFCVGKVLT